MKIEKRTDKKYPYRVTLSNGRTMKVAKQSKFSTKWLRKHGCPFISQYEVYQYLGMNTKDLMPMDLWKYAKKHLEKYLHATLVIKGLLAEVKHFVKGKAKAKYYAPNAVTTDKITKFLKAGAIIIITRGMPKPIHYYTLVYDDGAIWAIRFRGCTIKKRSAKFIVNTRSKNKKYGGMIVITPNKPKKPSKPKKTTTKKPATTSKKVTKKVVDDVIAGKYGNGETRKKKLKAAGYDYKKVQAEVNKRLK